MRTQLISVLCFIAWCLVGAPSPVTATVPVHMWSKHIGDARVQIDTRAATGTGTDIAVAGGFSGVVNFGGGSLVASNLALEDVFVVKLDAAGNHLWSRRFGDLQVQEARAVAMGPSGEIAITGEFLGSINFGGATFSVPFGQYRDIFVAVFDAGGNHVWSRAFAGTLLDAGRAIAFDPSGNVIVGGHYSGSVDFGGGPLPSGGGLTDAFLVKYDGSGAHLWSRAFAHGGDEAVLAVAADAAGNVIAAGAFDFIINLGAGILPTAGDQDTFLAKYDPSGGYLWGKRFGSTSDQRILAVAVNATGDLALAGEFLNSIDLGGGALPHGGGMDGFVARLDGGGNHVWSRSFGDGAVQSARSVALSSAGVVITGALSGTADFGGGPLTSFGGEDVFVARFDNAGGHMWDIAFGDGANEKAASVAVDAAGDIIINGFFDGGIDFGGGPFTAYGGGDFFLAKLDEEDVVPVLITDFSARVTGEGVEVRWRVAADEALDRYVLNRWMDDAPQPVVVVGGAWGIGTPGTIDTDISPGKTYHYELSVMTRSATEFRSPIATVSVPAAGLSLAQNAPNPFNPVTTIAYSLPSSSRAVIGIYNAGGQLVRRLDEGVQPAGAHAGTWDGRDAAGRRVASGVYFYRLEGLPSAGTRRMVLLK